MFFLFTFVVFTLKKSLITFLQYYEVFVLDFSPSVAWSVLSFFGTIMSSINAEIEQCVRRKTAWTQLPLHVKQIFKHIPKEYEQFVFNYSVRNQLRWRGNIVKKIFKNESRYYEILVEKSIVHLNLFPYHLADVITKGLRYTPFNYYLDVLSFMLKHDKSYDTLPNFTAADCK